jgi:hypothetical protein
MKISKTIQSLLNLKKKSTTGSKVISELVNPRFEIKSSVSLKPKKVSNSLLFQMYSRENEILFI